MIDVSYKDLKSTDPQIFDLLRKETDRKEYSLELIASENVVSDAVIQATGSIFTDKYCEGYPGKRYYGGCQYYDSVENIAIERAKKMFDGVEHVNVQPHSGASANMAVLLGLLKTGDTILGPKLDHGGHLTHGSSVNFSGKLFNAVGYGVNTTTGLIEPDEIFKLAKELKPKMIICGASAYSRQIDFAMFRKVADEVGALLFADVSHYAGLIVGGAYQSPVGLADIITTTTHKTLRGPRGGIILCKADFARKINSTVFPGLQGGPLMHQIAAKAVAFGEALRPEFTEYAGSVVSNARRLVKELQGFGYNILSGGTDSHMMVLDLRGTELTGNVLEEALGKVGITVNKNTVPGDPQKPAVTSGIRIGTAAITTRGFKEEDMKSIAKLIHEAIENRDNSEKLSSLREDVKSLCTGFPLYQSLIGRLDAVSNL